ncbi:hypothetical protein FPZ43_13275 [Mucilaginibacter pallidiroseus]|uniref:Uncharacterized protein n=1 Tax=Mucilaginibacter pallidiroseus TaxID=2599295 RepID=A0A563U7Y4_9SPHI|nr:hypothetical protein [Mucilaginibacter pallidiroseus]TWR27446.1 hypothetical protein FPZ43_13275 [Mucilaginibacter pallidiroseus]
MDRNSEIKEPGGIVSKAMPACNKNFTPFQNYFLYSNNSTQKTPAKHRPYTRIDALTTALSITTGWIVVAAIIYSIICQLIGGPGVKSAVIYFAALCLICILLRRQLSNYLSYNISEANIPKHQ